MKVKINRVGQLEIFRYDIWVRQRCPYRQDRVMCGDWCPLFGEPDEGGMDICGAIWDADEVVADERGIA